MPSVVMFAQAWMLALLIDQAFGEYPNRWHPVVWMGRAITWGEKVFLGRGSTLEFWGGFILLILIPTFFALLSWISIAILSDVPLLQLLMTAFWLKASFALRALGGAALQVRQHLAQGDLEQARQELRSLCSRNASQLSEEELTEAAMSSLAENLSDSVIAPWFFAIFFGVPGAIFYRVVNTMDAMIGYKNHYKNLGFAAARTDDALNLIPARLTAVFLLASGFLLARFRSLKSPGVRNAWLIARRDHGLTPSPNGGWPMATMAGLLGIQLRKKGVYSLGTAHRPSALPLMQDAWRLAQLAAWLAWPLFFTASLFYRGARL